MVDTQDEKIVTVDTDEESTESIEAKAKAVEDEIKDLKLSKEDEIRSNQKRRLEKANEKLLKLKESQQDDISFDSTDIRDLITLGKLDIAEDSEEAKTLEKYKKAGLISDYKSGLDNVAIKAEFEAIKAKNNASAIVDESDVDGYTRSKKEIIAQYRVTGNVPANPKLQKDLTIDVAKDNLKNMGL